MDHVRRNREKGLRCVSLLKKGCAVVIELYREGKENFFIREREHLMFV